MRLKAFFIGAFLIIFIATFIISIFICFFIEDGYIKIKRSEDPSPIETTEGPAPTALDDDENEDGDFEENFVYGTPYMGQTIHISLQIILNTIKNYFSVVFSFLTFLKNII